MGTWHFKVHLVRDEFRSFTCVPGGLIITFRYPFTLFLIARNVIADCKKRGLNRCIGWKIPFTCNVFASVPFIFTRGNFTVCESDEELSAFYWSLLYSLVLEHYSEYEVLPNLVLCALSCIANKMIKKTKTNQSVHCCLLVWIIDTFKSNKSAALYCTRSCFIFR